MPRKRPSSHPPAARPWRDPMRPTGLAARTLRRRWLLCSAAVPAVAACGTHSLCPNSAAPSFPTSSSIVRAAVSRERNTFLKKRKKEKENDTLPTSPHHHPTPGPIYPPFPLPSASHRPDPGLPHSQDQCPGRRRR
ncbi:mCG147910 [Mus musculus]|uniref:Uncharacterized protein n=1 Tax=Mus musculus TaxID=10090 RepID=Q8BQQ2_MOUSE|nr:mCG147910 [Mus musculus]BAC32844.1 unnamed protein product [Mus musculus]